MSADSRVQSAREFLDGTRKHKVTELPPSVLVRENAELRRQLGQVLDVVVGLEADQARISEIRAILAAFDWERDDRQYALERINEIAGSTS